MLVGNLIYSDEGNEDGEFTLVDGETDADEGTEDEEVVFEEPKTVEELEAEILELEEMVNTGCPACSDNDLCNGVVDACGVCNGPGIPYGSCDCEGHVEDCLG